MALICTTNNKDLRPLGGRASYSWEQLSERLASLGPDFASLLAQPVSEPGWQKIDWYGPDEEKIVPIADLSAEERTALYQRLGEIHQKVEDLAKTVAGPAAGGDKLFAEALRQAVNVPGDDRYVWARRDRSADAYKPLLVGWGHTRIDDARNDQQITRDGYFLRLGYLKPRAPDDPPAAVIDAPPPPPRQKRRFPWAALLWLLFVGLLASIYGLLLPACAIFSDLHDSFLARFLPNACFAAQADPLEAERDRQRILERQIHEAELDEARLQAKCLPPEKPAKPIPIKSPRRAEAPAPPQPPTMDQRLDRENAKSGELQISLVWDGPEDLDLSVKCPGGKIDYENKNKCGGVLNVDMNYGSHHSSTPVENVVWTSTPPSGAYEVFVKLSSPDKFPARSLPFTLRIKQGGTITNEIPGVVPPRSGTAQRVHTFQQP